MYHYRTANVDLVYDAYYESPLFDLPSKQTDVIKEIYGSIGKRWFLPLNNLQVIGGATMADIRLLVTLFSGSGTIEVSAEKLSAKFKGVVRNKDSNDTDIIKDVIRLAMDSVKKVFEQVEINNENFSVNADLFIDKEFDAVEHLSKYTKIFDGIDVESLGDVVVRHGVRVEFNEANNAWKTAVLLAPSHNEKSNLFCNLFSMFEYPATRKMSLDNKISHMDHAVDAVLHSVDIQESK